MRLMNRNFILILAAAILCAGCNSGSMPIEKAGAAPPNTTPVNLAAEIARAKTENKLLLLEFGSSDSCPPCIELEEKVFSKPEFQAYEKANLVFVRLDFPAETDLPPQVKATNEFLAEQFGAFLFPTFVAINHEGKEFWRLPQKGEFALDTEIFSPKGFIALLESVKKKRK
jgi:thioredoxin-related protein